MLVETLGPLKKSFFIIEFIVDILDIALAPKVEFMQMRVLPAHDNLNDIVQPIERNLGRYNELTPDNGLDLTHFDSKKVIFLFHQDFPFGEREKADASLCHALFIIHYPPGQSTLKTIARQLQHKPGKLSKTPLSNPQMLYSG